MVLLSVALLAGVGGVFSYRSTSALLAHGERVTGQVVSMTTSSRGTPHPVYIFTATDGHRYRVVSNTYSMFAAHYIGERIPLVYAAGAPQEARIEETSSLYGVSMICSIFCVIPLMMSIMAFRARSKDVAAERDYIQRNGREIHVELSSDRGHWGIPKTRRLRFALWSCALLTLPIVSIFFSERPTIIIVTILSLASEAFLLLFSALPNQDDVVKASSATNFYSRGYLWFQGIFWTLLICFVVWKLWAQFPR